MRNFGIPCAMLLAPRMNYRTHVTKNDFQILFHKIFHSSYKNLNNNVDLIYLRYGTSVWLI